MRILSSLLPFTLLLLLACSNTTKPEAEATNTPPPATTTSTPPTATTHAQVVTQTKSLTALFTHADAEKILGEKATITDSLMSNQSNIKAYKSSYTGKANGDKTGMASFLIEEYGREADAISKYGFIKAANENHPGYKTLTGMGDEGYFHGDGNAFYFTSVRKGGKVYNLKVKITPTTSLEAFNATAKRIADNM